MLIFSCSQDVEVTNEEMKIIKNVLVNARNTYMSKLEDGVINSITVIRSTLKKVDTLQSIIEKL